MATPLQPHLTVSRNLLVTHNAKTVLYAPLEVPSLAYFMPA
jgi:hypothetical protein